MSAEMVAPQERPGAKRRARKAGAREAGGLTSNTAWRLFKFQRDYRGVLWAREKLRAANGSRAKQIAVALARRFLVDWWRIRTGRATAAELGFVFRPATATP